MKNDQRIIELLSESLQKQDRLTDAVSTLTDTVSGLTDAVSDLKEVATSQLKVQQQMADILTHQGKRLDDLEGLESEVKNISFKLSQALDFQRQINAINERLDRLENAS